MNLSKKILLIEDDEDDQLFFTEALSKIKNTILYSIAGNGEEALRKLKNSITLPDLIFMDINMPLMNGIECLEEIIKDPQTRNIPVFMLSTSAYQSELVLHLGAKAFVQKTSDEITLRTKLEQLINLYSSSFAVAGVPGS